MDVGPIIMVIVLVVLIPVGVLITCGVIAAFLGTFAKDDVADEYEGSEYLELGR